MSESLKDALLDGKTQIDQYRELSLAAKSEIDTLKESLLKTKAELVLEQKTAKLPQKKKEYAQRVFEGKNPKFILENIDYTLSLFDKKEEERIDSLKKEAFEQRKVKTDRVVLEEEKVLVEEKEEENFTTVKNYLTELSKY
jgi:predicted choloylglycine hydrolase